MFLRVSEPTAIAILRTQEGEASTMFRIIVSVEDTSA